MKKLLALFLSFILCIGLLASCDRGEEESFSESSFDPTQNEMLVKEIDSNITIQLSEQDAEAIENILNEGAWINDITKTTPDYIFCFSGSEIKYASSGIFNDWGSDEWGDECGLHLNDEQTNQINSMLEKYFSH